MSIKRICLSLIFLVSLHVNAQKIQYKDGSVTVDGTECLTYTKGPTHVEVTTLDGNHTVLLKYIRTGEGPNGGLYYKIIFVQQQKSLTTRSYNFTKKLLVKKLMQSNVLNDCKIDESKIDRFILTYDENIEEQLIRR